MQRLAFGLLDPVVGGLVERFAGVGDGEVDDGGDAAARAGARAGAIVVGGDGAAERQLEMDVDVEHAGNDVVPARVDHLRALGVEAGAERGDLLAGDPDVADERAGRRDDVPALDDRVEFHMAPAAIRFHGAGFSSFCVR